MATTQQVMATTPVLNSPKDWYQWYIALENFADAKGIWDYVNPESETYKYLERRYHDERAEFRLLRDALEKLVEHLFKTVNSRYMTISLGGQSNANMTTYEEFRVRARKPGSRIGSKQLKKWLNLILKLR